MPKRCGFLHILSWFHIRLWRARPPPEAGPPPAITGPPQAQQRGNEVPLWLSILAMIAQVIYTLWLWSAIFKRNMVKGTRRQVVLHEVTCELRPFIWPSYTIMEFRDVVKFFTTKHEDWYDFPLIVIGGAFVALVIWFYMWITKGDDDDRWTKRGKKLGSKIKQKLVIQRPATTRA